MAVCMAASDSRIVWASTVDGGVVLPNYLAHIFLIIWHLFVEDLPAIPKACREIARLLRPYLEEGCLLRCEYFERGMLRLTGMWQGHGRTGEEFARENHLYQVTPHETEIYVRLQKVDVMLSIV
jgi:hypothetical protein